MADVISLQTLERIGASPQTAEEFSAAGGCNYLAVDMRDQAAPVTLRFQPVAPVIGLGSPHPAADAIAADDTDLAGLTDAIDRQPQAAATLVQVLRHNEQADVQQGLLAESLAYSTLQHAAGFRAWLQIGSRPQSQSDPQSPLLVEREAARLTLTLNRPHVHNAYSEALKDALCEALHLAHADKSIEHVCLRGSGKSFSAGGDLSEFGAAADAGAAHLSRTTRSAGALLAALTCDTQALLHGACIGAGIELPAFTGHVTAHPDAFFQLPEVAMGLIPGAGGTVSVLRRAGRHHTAYMALSNKRIDAQTALDWGLVDELSAEVGLDDPA